MVVAAKLRLAATFLRPWIIAATARIVIITDEDLFLIERLANRVAMGGNVRLIRTNDVAAIAEAGKPARPIGEHIGIAKMVTLHIVLGAVM